MTGGNSLLLRIGSLLAAGERWGGKPAGQPRLEASGSDGWYIIWSLVALAVIGAVVWLVYVFLAARARKWAHSPRRLYRELCRAHGLGRREEQLLGALADRHRLPHAALLFIDPRRFDVGNLGPALAGEAAAITALRNRLFGTDDDAFAAAARSLDA